MAGGFDLEFVEFLAKWELAHPEVNCADWLVLAEYALRDFKVEHIHLPDDFGNKPMSGLLAVKSQHCTSQPRFVSFHR
jgi:hypothetical protein